MARSVLQLSCRRGLAASDTHIATTVPRHRGRPWRAGNATVRFRLCGLLRAVAAICCILATTLSTTVARAQAPSEAEAIDAFIAVRGWLDRDALPALDAREAQVDLPGTAALTVLLRIDGRVVGRGEDAAGDPLMVRRAAGRAVSEALGDQTIRAVRTELGDRVTARLSLEIELAGQTRPLLGRTVAEASERIVPGAEGIALLKGDEVFRAFPSRLLANDSADRPDAAITGLMRTAGLPARELRDFGPADRVSLGRFETIRLRQGSPDKAPSVLVRGGRLIECEEITPGFVRALAAQLAARLSAQVMPLPSGPAGEETEPPRQPRWGLLGTYNPTADTYDPAFAGPRDEAFAALALARASRSSALPDPTRKRAAIAAQNLIEALLARTPADRGDGGDATTLLALRTLAEGQGAASSAGLLERVRRSTQTILATLTASSVDGQSAPLDGTTLEIAAMSAAALSAPGSSTEDRALAGSIIDALLARTASARARLADGMLALGLVAGSNAFPEDTLRTLRDALDEVAARLDALQRLPAKAGDSSLHTAGEGTALSLDTPADLVGGFELPGVRAVKVDAQGIRIAAALAVLRRAEKPGEPFDVRLRASLRFLAQHVADEPWTDGFRRAEALRGLVRGSLASDDCPPAATAAGLLLATEAMAERSQ